MEQNGTEMERNYHLKYRMEWVWNAEWLDMEGRGCNCTHTDFHSKVYGKFGQNSYIRNLPNLHYVHGWIETVVLPDPQSLDTNSIAV